jgi:antitoxin component of MazEF toxin-antitoxin module
MAVTIKPALCRALGWTSGDSVIMCISGQHLIIRRVGRSDVLDTDFIPVGELPGKGKKNADQ